MPLALASGMDEFSIISPQFLIGQNNLRQADLVSIFGSRGRVSEVVNGKRAISKAQAERWENSSKCRQSCSFEQLRAIALLAL
jgi:antitoxin component HigA of HigAB toxin-antitoxin module